MQIIKSTDPIAVEHPVFLIFGQPGVGKSSLGYSAPDPLLLDFDSGAHRAANRRDTLKITAWADVEDMMRSKAALDAYQSIVVDTVGRCLDLMILDILSESPKNGDNGAPSQKGWGILKGRFRGWLTELRAMGKDVILIAHHKEEKDGDVTQIRPDIVGGSYGEVLKNADFVGFLSMVGKQRVLDFSPTDKWVGKNPAQWKPVPIPPVEKATAVLEQLIAQGRQALGQISAQSATLAQQVEAWKQRIAAFVTAEDFTTGRTELERLPEIARAQLRGPFKTQADTLGLTWDKGAKVYVAPPPKPNGAALTTPVTASDLVW